MKLINDKRPRLPIEDYSIALRKAIAWLGERYVLAIPVEPGITDASDHTLMSREPPMEHAQPAWCKTCPCNERKEATLKS
jgi:hypothetical protein